eukprot:7349895-Alexandrium_andersonii.AAC.2
MVEPKVVKPLALRWWAAHRPKHYNPVHVSHRTWIRHTSKVALELEHCTIYTCREAPEGRQLRDKTAFSACSAERACGALQALKAVLSLSCRRSGAARTWDLSGAVSGRTVNLHGR